MFKKPNTTLVGAQPNQTIPNTGRKQQWRNRTETGNWWQKHPKTQNMSNPGQKTTIPTAASYICLHTMYTLTSPNTRHSRDRKSATNELKTRKNDVKRA